MSRIISKHLIDYFVPFLPLERRHIIMCFRDYLHSKNVVYTQEQLENLADQLSVFFNFLLKNFLLKIFFENFKNFKNFVKFF